MDGFSCINDFLDGFKVAKVAEKITTKKKTCTVFSVYDFYAISIKIVYNIPMIISINCLFSYLTIRFSFTKTFV